MPSSKIYQLIGLSEVRNRIYDFCESSSNANVNLYLPPHKGAKPKPNPFSKRQSLGLTQVSRQIRFEYLPIHLRRHRFCIPYQDLAQCLSTFITMPGIQDCEATGNITVDVGYHFRLDNMKPGHVDILPLLKLYGKAPGLNIDFRLDHRDQQQEMDKVMNIKKAEFTSNHKWAGFLNTDLEQMFFQGGSWTYRFDFVMSLESRKGWLDIAYYRPWAGGRSYWYLTKGEEKAWKKHSGLSLDFETTLAMVSWKEDDVI